MKKREEVRGSVFDIQRFCLHDGPGIRTTVFLKGCPLHCAWCHNAEGLSPKVQLYFEKEKCILCGKCQKACPNGVHLLRDGAHFLDLSLCKSCFLCGKVCPAEALTSIGEEMNAEHVVENVLRDEAFFRSSGGGVTLSGGEPLMQGEFAASLASLLKEKGVHVCVETSGYASEKAILEIAPFVDIFLFDYKLSEKEDHKKYTGVSLEKILQNLNLLSDLKKSVILRCPIIPGVNDHEKHYRAIASLAEKTESVTEVRLEPYHPFGLKKYEALGTVPVYDREEMMEEDKIQKARDIIASLTKKEVIL